MKISGFKSEVVCLGSAFDDVRCCPFEFKLKTFTDLNVGRHIDYAILEKADNVAVLRARFSWNDLGSWSALHQQLGDSPLANVSINTDVLADNAKGNLIYSSAQQKVIVKDVDDLIVVLTDDQVMILPKKADQSVKQLQQMIENTKKEKD